MNVSTNSVLTGKSRSKEGSRIISGGPSYYVLVFKFHLRSKSRGMRRSRHGSYTYSREENCITILTENPRESGGLGDSGIWI